MKKKKHNVFAHLLLGAVLFAINVWVFDGLGTWSALLGTSAQVTGTMIVATQDLGAAASHMQTLVPLAITVLANLIIYYVLAGVIIFLFALITRDRSVA